MNDERIKNRVAGREAAKALYSLLLADNGSQPWTNGHGADYAEALLDELTKLLPHRKKPEPEPVKLEPIARLGATQIDFGKHAGQTYDETDLDYLDWLCKVQEDNLRILKAYLTHPELKARRGDV